jgi:hypothetical protein
MGVLGLGHLHLGSFGGFLQWGYPNSWMVYNRKSENKMDHLAVPPFWEISIFHGETMVK